MLLGDLIDVTGACALLNISVPTFRKYRQLYAIREYRIRKKINFSKTEILQKIYTRLVPLDHKTDFWVFSNTAFEDLKIGPDIYDLRKIDQIDGHGAISLVCHLMSQVLRKAGTYTLFVITQMIFLRQ